MLPSVAKHTHIAEWIIQARQRREEEEEEERGNLQTSTGVSYTSVRGEAHSTCFSVDVPVDQSVRVRMCGWRKGEERNHAYRPSMCCLQFIAPLGSKNSTIAYPLDLPFSCPTKSVEEGKE